MLSSKFEYSKTNSYISFPKLTISSNLIKNITCFSPVSLIALPYFSTTIEKNTFENITTLEQELIGIITAKFIYNYESYFDLSDKLWLLTIKNNIFKNNKGQILYFLNLNENVKVTISSNIYSILNNYFEGNKVNTTSIINIYSSKYFNLTNNTLFNNIGHYGGIYTDALSESLIDYLTIKNGQGELAACGKFSDPGKDVIIKNFLCENNSLFKYKYPSSYEHQEWGLTQIALSTLHLGKIMKNLIINNLTLINNQAWVSGFYYEGNSLVVNGINIISTVSPNEFPVGGWISKNSIIKVFNVIAKDNICAKCVGGIFVVVTSNFYLNNCLFYNNTALQGTGVYNNQSTFYVRGGNFTLNVATKNDAVIFNKIGYLNLTNCVFVKNTAGKQNIISFSSTDAYIYNCKFIGNSAVKKSKNFFAKLSTLKIKKSYFEDFNQDSGNVDTSFINSIDTEITLDDNIFNGTYSYYGSLHISGNTNTLNILNCKFVNNFANYQGRINLYYILLYIL